MSEPVPDILLISEAINIRPSQGNQSMEIEDEAVQMQVRELTYRLIGRGEALP
jgi:hypothetical protein